MEEEIDFFRVQVRTIRKKRKFTIAQMAKLLGVTERTMAAWERGENKPKQTDIRVIAQILDVSVKEISTLEDFKFDSEKPYYLEGLNSIAQVQEQISSNLAIEEKSWILGLLIKIDALSARTNFYKMNAAKAVAIVDSLQLFVYSKNEKLEFTYANPAFLSFLHVSHEEIMGKSDSYFLGDKDVSFISELQETALKGITTISREITIPGSHGKSKGLFSATPIMDEKGKITGLTATIEDITDKAATDEHLRQIERVINKSNDLLWIKTGRPILRTFFVSSAISKIAGITPGELQKSENLWLKMIHDDDKEKVKKLYEQKEEGSIEYRIITASEETKWLSEDYYPTEENITFSIIRDITKEKTLSIKNEIFALASDEASEGFWLFDEHEKKHVIFNRAETDMTGLTKEDYMGDRYSFNKTICKKDRLRIFKRYVKNRKIRKNFRATYQIENVKTKQKRKVRVSTHWLTIRGRNYTFGITRDITIKDK